MKILHIGKYGEISQILKNEAEKRGHQYSNVSPFDISIQYTNKLLIQIQNMDLLDYDIYLFRGIKRNIAEIIAMYLQYNNKLVIDNDLAFKKILDFKNIYPPTENIKLPFIPFILFPTSKDIEDFKYPAILKDTHGKKGKNVYLVKSSKETKELIQKNIDIKFMLQEFIQSEKEIRIIFVGDKVIPLGMEKINDNSVIKNIAKGATGKAYKLNNEEIEIAKKCKTISKLDIGGIDLIKSKDNKYYVLEINRAPVFLEFNVATGIKIEKEILDFMETKLSLLKKM